MTNPTPPSLNKSGRKKELVRNPTLDSLRRAAEVLRHAIDDAGESENVPLYRGFAKLLAAQLEQEIAFRNTRARNRANPYDAGRLPDVG